MSEEEELRLVKRYAGEPTEILMAYWEKMYRGDMKARVKEEPYKTIFMLINSELDRRGIIKVCD